MHCLSRFKSQVLERREIYKLIMRQSADLLNMIDRRAVHTRPVRDPLEVRVLERDLRLNIIKFNSSVMRAGFIDKLFYKEEMMEQLRVVERQQQRIVTFTLTNSPLIR